ncbi:MAG: cyclopropane-fatty-acyl-phospholipid synthase family protein [Opitutus sp.]
MTPSPAPSVTLATLASAATPSFAQRSVLGALQKMPRGQLKLELPDGSVHRLGDPTAWCGRATDESVFASIRVLRPDFFKRCFWSGDIGFAEAFMEGDWDSPEPAAVVKWFILNIDTAPTLSGSQRAQSWVLNALRFGNRVGHLLRPNSRRIARRNISDHYDLSNEFFALWLDPSMMYSAGKWTPRGASLEDAQREKNDALCRSLKLQPTDHALEIGTGWGGWALHAAKTYGCRVTSVTISQQQFEFAKARIAAAGLSHQIDVQLCDYRDLTGRFDKIVSIEMMEAIGHRYLPDFCATLERVLAPHGLIALQFITCPDARYDEFRHGVDFIQKHVFPGSLLLSLNRVNEQLSRAGGFVVHRVDDMAGDYVLTLRAWHEAFRSRLSEVRALGFDERFIRKWTYYLAYCEAAFAMRNISVVQTVHTRPNNVSL